MRDRGRGAAGEEADIIIWHRDELEDAEDGTQSKKYFESFGKIKKDLAELDCPNAAASSRWFTNTAGPAGASQFFIVSLVSAGSTMPLPSHGLNR